MIDTKQNYLDRLSAHVPLDDGMEKYDAIRHGQSPETLTGCGHYCLATTLTIRAHHPLNRESTLAPQAGGIDEVPLAGCRA